MRDAHPVRFSSCRSSLFGIVGKDFVLLAADRNAARSIVQYKADEDKLTQLDQYKLLGATGPTGDRNNFCEYIQKNITLYELRTGVSLSTHAAAKYTRNQLAEALRQNPYQVSLLLGGWDKATGPSMYYMDYLGSMHQMKIAAHGYASYFGLSIMDRYWKENMTVEEAVDLLQKCISELKTRFILSLQEFKIKIVDKDGVRDLNPDPAPPAIDMGKGELPPTAVPGAASPAMTD